MTSSAFSRCARLVLLVWALPALVVLARAQTQTPIKGTPASFTAECSSCHLAYAPFLTGQANWRGIMAGLDKHYGADASLDSKTQREISTWLLANAASSASLAAVSPDFRITRSEWFIRKHYWSASVWKRASIKSASNCGACHSGAARSDFDAGSVRVPK
jgi:nitrate/TMAO reductase-like tetraheme cytochrome c subunit